MARENYSDARLGALSITDKHGNRLTPSEEVSVISRAVRGNDEFPDIDQTWFESYEAFCEWEMNGRQMFLCQ